MGIALTCIPKSRFEEYGKWSYENNKQFWWLNFWIIQPKPIPDWHMILLRILGVVTLSIGIILLRAAILHI